MASWGLNSKIPFPGTPSSTSRKYGTEMFKGWLNCVPISPREGSFTDRIPVCKWTITLSNLLPSFPLKHRSSNVYICICVYIYMYVYMRMYQVMYIYMYWSEGLSLGRICRTPPPQKGHIYVKDAHSAESNEKSIFRFLFFELWLIVFTIHGDTPGFSSVSPTQIVYVCSCIEANRRLPGLILSERLNGDIFWILVRLTRAITAGIFKGKC